MNKQLLDEYYTISAKLIKKNIIDIDKYINRINEIENLLRDPNQTYYFIDSPIYGTTKCVNGYLRSWINDVYEKDDEKVFYHYITKNEKDNFYKYFVYKNNKLPENYEPIEFTKLVTFNDAMNVNMKVHSQFSKIEADLRHRF